jgi:hypothetical protein
LWFAWNNQFFLRYRSSSVSKSRVNNRANVSELLRCSYISLHISCSNESLTGVPIFRAISCGGNSTTDELLRYSIWMLFHSVLFLKKKKFKFFFQNFLEDFIFHEARYITMSGKYIFILDIPDISVIISARNTHLPNKLWLSHVM